MQNPSIPLQRVHNQRLSDHNFSSPSDVVAWFGAVQSQDFAAAKWALGLRMKHATDLAIEKAFDEGTIVRTHIMRPTWHFVHSKDIRWLLKLTSPRVQKFNGYYYRKSGLDRSIFERSNTLITQALKDRKQLTRNELNTILMKEAIPTDALGLSFTIIQAELEGIICSGPRRGKQFTYMLLEERVPSTAELTYDESLVELVVRYFQSHGPAQMQDFAWWSGLTVSDAKKGIALAELEQTNLEGKTYWYTRKSANTIVSDIVYLAPPFDEYFVAYKDRSDLLDSRYAKHMNFGGGMISGAIIYRGIIIGTWKRSFTKDTVRITVYPFSSFSKEEMISIENAAGKYGGFHGVKAMLTINN